jgi:hypothetical protein
MYRTNTGVLTLAFGHRRYLDQAETLALSLKRHMPMTKIAVVTDLVPEPGLFDFVVPLVPERGKSFLQKLWIDQYSPFEKTVFIDSDCLVGRDFSDQIERMSKYSFTPVCEKYLEPGQQDGDGWVDNIEHALALCGGSVYPKFNGGVYYFDRSDEARKVFEIARSIQARATQFGLDRPNGGEPGDEPIFALALSSLDLLPLYDDDGMLMRTPIGISGGISMDRSFGSFSFMKYGSRVEPAICHFAGDYVRRLEYLAAAAFLRSGKYGTRESIQSIASYTAGRFSRGWRKLAG